jgi:hypothetical protein
MTSRPTPCTWAQPSFGIYTFGSDEMSLTRIRVILFIITVIAGCTVRCRTVLPHARFERVE